MFLAERRQVLYSGMLPIAEHYRLYDERTRERMCRWNDAFTVDESARQNKLVENEMGRGRAVGLGPGATALSEEARIVSPLMEDPHDIRPLVSDEIEHYVAAEKRLPVAKTPKPRLVHEGVHEWEPREVPHHLVCAIHEAAGRREPGAPDRELDYLSLVPLRSRGEPHPAGHIAP